MIQLKLIKNKPSYCGPATLAVVLNYYGRKYSQDELARLTNTTIQDGCIEANLVTAARKLDFSAYTKIDSSLAKLRKLNTRGVPTIVDWQSPWTGEHYSIVAGFEREKIVLASTFLGRYEPVDIEEFKKRWYIVENGEKIKRVITVITPKRREK